MNVKGLKITILLDKKIAIFPQKKARHAILYPHQAMT